jgi:quinol monooxygenase YgiN
MHARVSYISGSTENVDAGIDNFRNNALPAIRSEEGCSGGILLVDRDTGKGMAITLWADEEAMRASEERANALRAQAADAMGAGQAASVERFEVAVFET